MTESPTPISRASLVAGTFLALHIGFAFWHPLPMWGIDLLAYAPAWAQVLFACLSILLLLPTVRTRLLTAIRLPDPLNPWKTPRASWVATLLLTGVGLLGFVALRSSIHLLGDGYLLLRDLPMFNPQTSWKGINAPLIYWSVKTIYHSGISLWPSPEAAYQTFSYVAGVGYLILCLPAARSFGKDTVERTLILAFLLTSGFVQLFFGYVETYPVLLPAILVYLLTGARALRGATPLWVPSLVLGLMIPLHFTLVTFVPSLFVLAYFHIETVESPSNETRSIAALKTLGLLALTPAASLLVLLLIGFNPAVYFQTAGSSHMLPLFSEPGFFYHYRLFSIAHLSDLLNHYLLVAPAALLVPFVAGRRSTLPDPLRMFFLAAAAFSVLFTLIANPEVGAFRDWDAFAYPALPLTLWAARILIDRTPNPTHLKHIGLLICGAAALHTTLWICVNTSPTRMENRFANLLNGGFLSPNARSYGWETLGMYYREHDKLEPAAHAYEQATHANPQNPRHWISLGNRYMDLERYAEALRAFQHGIELEPEFTGTYSRNLANAYLSIGNTHYRMGRYEDATQFYQKVLEIHPGQSDAHFNLGNTYNKLGRYQDAVSSYQKALEFDPYRSNAHVNMANSLSSLGQLEKAIQHYRKALELEPNHIQAYLNLGIVFQRLDQIQDAKICLERVLELDPQNPQAPAIHAWLRQHP